MHVGGSLRACVCMDLCTCVCIQHVNVWQYCCVYNTLILQSFLFACICVMSGSVMLPSLTIVARQGK